MAFDIHALDDVDVSHEEADDVLEDYISAIWEAFAASEEYRGLPGSENGGPGWVEPFVRLGFRYLGRGLPGLTVGDVDEIVTELFPRKITVFEPEEARAIAPELVALWQFVGREYDLPNAEPVLEYLRSLDPGDIVDIMNDPDRFGMAKSFMTAGHNAGFDMTDETQARAFTALYNQNAARLSEADDFQVEPAGFGAPPTTPAPSRTSKRKRRKTARASRKAQNRKRKKK